MVSCVSRSPSTFSWKRYFYSSVHINPDYNVSVNYSDHPTIPNWLTNFTCELLVNTLSIVRSWLTSSVSLAPISFLLQHTSFSAFLHQNPYFTRSNKQKAQNAPLTSGHEYNRNQDGCQTELKRLQDYAAGLTGSCCRCRLTTKLAQPLTHHHRDRRYRHRAFAKLRCVLRWGSLLRLLGAIGRPLSSTKIASSCAPNGLDPSPAAAEQAHRVSSKRTNERDRCKVPL